MIISWSSNIGHKLSRHQTTIQTILMHTPRHSIIQSDQLAACGSGISSYNDAGHSIWPFQGSTNIFSSLQTKKGHIMGKILI